MSVACPNGHQSEWPDWCSICGERLADADSADAAAVPVAAGAAPQAAAPPLSGAVAGGPSCDNCGVGRNEHDVFCESCGYDFASGSLPVVASEIPGVSDASATPMHAKVAVDSAFFDASTGDVDLILPDPLPDSQIVPLAGTRILIGRHSASRGIFPEIDVQALTGDPAVSSRHAMLERDASHNWTLTDLGSTNGTFLLPNADQPIAAGTALPIAPGTRIYLGAWTSIELAETAT